MPNISGNVRYATGRYGGISGISGVPSIPVVVQNVATNVGLVALTGGGGSYFVNSIPAGTYRIVEAYGATGGVATPVDFSLVATTIPVPTPQDPPITAIPAPIGGTNKVDSLSPNTLYITITTSNIAANDFMDSSISNVPLVLPTGTVIGNSVLTLAGNGIWGTLPASISVNTNPVTYPYANSMVSSLFTYVNNNSAIGPINVFTMTNINTLVWFFLSNHTTFDERSSMLLVNGNDPNALLFKETVSVTPNSFYLASAWLAMITPEPNTCLIGFKVLAEDGVTQLFYGQTSNVVYGQWGEIGQIFNTGNNSQVTVEVLSMSTIINGNDFALDDVALSGVTFNNVVTLDKTVDKIIAKIGDTLTYTSVINTNTNLSNVYFQDTLPTGLSFSIGSVKINGTGYGGYSPEAGFTIPSITSGALTTINFVADVVSVPIGGIVRNMSTSTYSFAPIPGNTLTMTIFSNTTATALQYADLKAYKTVNEMYGTVGDTLVYTITLTNSGNITATNSVFLDTIPQGTTLVQDSVVVNGISLPGVSPDPSQGGIGLGNISAAALTTITFDLLVITIPSINPIINIGMINYSYVPTGLTAVNANVSTNTVSTQINVATLTSIKKVDKQYADTGNTLTYSIVLTNNGNVTANQIIFIDTLPNGTTLVTNSLNQDGIMISGTTNTPGVTLPNSIGAGASSTITFQVIVITVPTTNPMLNSATQSYEYVIDPTTLSNRIGTGLNTSNTVTTQVNHANLGNITKFVDKLYVRCQDIITYTLIVPNAGNTIAQNLVFLDSIPSGTKFVSDSLTINGITMAGANPNVGVTLPDVAVDGINTITFQVQVEC